MISAMFLFIIGAVILSPLFFSYAAMVQDKTDASTHEDIKNFRKVVI